MNGYFLPTEASRAEFFDRFKTKCDAGRIGRSILGRSIDYYKLGYGKRNILAVGAHHAAEHITASALFAFIELLCGGGGFCECRDALSKACFWIVPCLNPDGVEMQICGPSASPLYERQLRMNGGEDFSLWQANARGVDLNHNYDAEFGEYKRIEMREGICRQEPLFRRIPGERAGDARYGVLCPRAHARRVGSSSHAGRRGLRQAAKRSLSPYRRARFISLRLYSLRSAGKRGLRRSLRLHGRQSRYTVLHRRARQRKKSAPVLRLPRNMRSRKYSASSFGNAAG